ncbi:MarR family transcriptional regulator [Mycoplasmatota bacterium WC44]
MEKELLRQSFNKFLRLYFDSCKEVYEEIGLNEITNRQFYYLNQIHKNTDVTSSKLAEICKLSKPTITEIIGKFIELKLAFKEQSVNDKRVSYIKLTERGKILATSNEIESTRVTEKIMNKLDEEELGSLKDLFDKIVK